MRRILTFVTAAILSCGSGSAQTMLADFEDGTAGRLTIDDSKTIAECFIERPAVMDNPDKTGINVSDKCLGAVNVANADWWGNMVALKLDNPVVVSDNNRILTFLCYRGGQPKEMRIGFNGYEDNCEIYSGRLPEDGCWERVAIDLGLNHKGEKLESIYIIFSCNWNEPRTGWGETTYCYDDFCLSSEAKMPAAEVVIRPETTYQTIVDFGASDCWTAEYIGRYFSTAAKEQAAKRLFSRGTDADGNPEGIGLSCWRVNIGAGSAAQGTNSNIEDETRRTECFLNADGTYDWTRQAGQQYFMQKALEYGVDHFVLFSNSAPVTMTKNGKANANNSKIDCNLSSTRFADFAEFLATTAGHFTDEGYNVTMVSPVNEPQFEWRDGQEGSPWRNADIAGLARELDKSLSDRGLATKILLPEASSLDMLYGGTGYASNQISAFFNSANPTTYLGDLPRVAKAVAGHSYWTFGTNSDLRDVREQAKEKAEKYGVELMQTEWSMLDAAPSVETGFPASYDAATYMDIALFMGKLIYCDLAFGNMTSWSYWTAFACEQWSQKNRFYLLRIRPTGGDYAPLTGGGAISDNSNLWVLGNYSYFIRPGYRRIRLEGAAEMNQLLGSAYIAPDESRIVAVFVNTARSPRTVSLKTDWNGHTVESMTGYVTDSNNGLKRLLEVEGAGQLTLPKRSVTTVVIELADGSGIKDVTSDVTKSGDGAIYTLDGRKVAHVGALGKGIYICDGRKSVVK